MEVICFIAGFIMGAVAVLVITLGLSANTPDDDDFYGGNL